MSWTKKSTFGSLPFTQRATALVLNGDPKGKNFLYCNGKTVYIRDINNPAICDSYTQHSTKVNVAQYAPSGYYIASGDDNGKLRIWDTVNLEHILKYEYQPFAGPIKDIDWSPDSKRIAIGGQGRSNFGACILWDSGSNVGEIKGHSKAINSITYKPTRPFRIATASEDTTCAFFEGPPFKFKHTMKAHSRFVNSIRYSPNGELICSGGSDCIAALYDGKTGELMSKLGGDKAHDGGIYGVSWSPDSSHVITASGDKSVKLWDVATQTSVSQFKIGSNIDDQQLGCLWQGDYILSVSLSGNINYLDKNDPEKPLRVLTGQNKNLTSIVTSYDSSKLYCGSMDGKINSSSVWTTDAGNVSLVAGTGHTNLVCSMAATPDTIQTLGLDKISKTILPDKNEYTSDVLSFPDRDPTSIAYSSNDGVFLVTSLNELFLVRDGKKVFSLPVTSEALCASFHPNKPYVAVGYKDSKVIVYSIEGDKLNEFKEFEVRGEVNAVGYDPSGELLAASGSARPVFLYETTSYTLKKEMLKQNARVRSLAWSPNGKRIATGGVDSNVCIYDIEAIDPIEIKGAHPMDIVTGVSWINDNTVASCGNDATIRIWEYSA